MGTKQPLIVEYTECGFRSTHHETVLRKVTELKELGGRENESRVNETPMKGQLLWGSALYNPTVCPIPYNLWFTVNSVCRVPFAKRISTVLPSLKLSSSPHSQTVTMIPFQASEFPGLSLSGFRGKDQQGRGSNSPALDRCPRMTMTWAGFVGRR